MRKTLFIKEIVRAEAGQDAAADPVTRVAALAVLENPFAGRFEENLQRCSIWVMQVGEELAPLAVEMLGGPAKAYGKAAIVGVNGDLEHAAALLHPKLGKPMRAACGGGEALIPSVTKVASAGAAHRCSPGPQGRGLVVRRARHHDGHGRRRAAAGRDPDDHGLFRRRPAKRQDRQGPRGGLDLRYKNREGEV